MENKTPEEILVDYIELARKEYPDQNWMSNEEILSCHENKFMIMAMEEYGKQQYNQAIKDAAENAKLLSYNKSLLHLPYGWEENEHSDLISGTKCKVSKDSILKLIKQ